MAQKIIENCERPLSDSPTSLFYKNVITKRSESSQLVITTSTTEMHIRLPLAIIGIPATIHLTFAPNAAAALLVQLELNYVPLGPLFGLSILWASPWIAMHLGQ